ncbi:MAG: hypothetical protein H6713_15985 [Myxococcales bacterium]|nr:hypothetical protein [Myxococcales bacterium]
MKVPTMHGAQLPFPGPTAFALRDPRYRDVGRPTRALAAAALGARLLIVHGRAGAGKSSLLRAAVLPSLADELGCRIAQVDAWPPGRAPAEVIAAALRELAPAPEREELASLDAVIEHAWRRAASEVVVLLDHAEELLCGARSGEGRGALLDAVEALAGHPGANLHVILVVRSDALDGLERELVARARLRGVVTRRVVVAPMTVEMLTASAISAARAAGSGAVAEDELRAAVLSARVPGSPNSSDAEVDATLAQLALRQRWRGGPALAEGDRAAALRAYVDGELARAGIAGVDAEGAWAALEGALTGPSGARPYVLSREVELAGAAAAALEHAGVVRAHPVAEGSLLRLSSEWLSGQLDVIRRLRDHERGRLAAEDAAASERARAESRARLARRLWSGLLGLGALSVALLVITTGSAWRASSANQLAESRAAEIEEQRARAERAEGERDTLSADIKVVRRQAELATGASFRRLLDAEDELYSPDVAARLLLGIREELRPGSWPSLARDALTASTGGASATALAWTADARRLLIAGTESGARLDPSLGGAAIAELAHDGPVTAALVSPDGALAVTVSGAVAKLWGARDGALRCAHEQGAPITRAAFSPDGRYVVTGGDDGGVKRWSCGGEARALAGLEGAVTSISFTGDGARVAASAKQQPSARWWDMEGDGAGEFTSGETSPLTVAGYGPHGKWFVGGTEGGLLHLWVDGQQYPLESFDGHDGPLRSLAFEQGGGRLVTGGADGRAFVRALPSGRKTHALRHKDPVVHVEFVHPGDRVLTVTADGRAWLWRAGRREPKILSEFPPAPAGKRRKGGDAPQVEELGEVLLARASPDGERTATVHADGRVHHRWLNGPREGDALLEALRGATRPCLGRPRPSAGSARAPASRSARTRATPRRAARRPATSASACSRGPAAGARASA